MKTSSRGFTLIEVMVALGIFAVSAAAIVMANTQSLRSAVLIEEQIQARAAAEDFLIEMRLGLDREFPDDGQHHEEYEHNGVMWMMDYRVETLKALPIIGPYMKDVELKTRRSDQEDYADVLRTYLGKYNS